MIFLNTLIKKLQNKEPFTFVRYGDGEWMNIFHENHDRKENCDGNLYYPELGQALYDIVVSEPEYYMGIQWCVLDAPEFCPVRDHVYDLIKDLRIDWVNANELHRASEFGVIQPFFDALLANNIILVGARYFERIPHVSHIVIPNVNCWLERDRIIDELFSVLLNRTNTGRGHTVILFMAGMAANYLAHEVYEQYGHIHTLIDMGSVLDPYVGRPRRGYHYKIITRL